MTESYCVVFQPLVAMISDSAVLYVSKKV